MVQRIRGRLTYANVGATLAVCLAIGGGVTLAAVKGSGTVKFGGEKGISFESYETVLSVPGVGKIQASCSKGTLVRFKNTSGKTLAATVERAADGDFEQGVLADGQSLESFGFFPVDTLRFHAFRRASSGTPATDITVGVSYPESPDCGGRTVTAQAVSKD
jgi:hypothetical protein